MNHDLVSEVIFTNDEAFSRINIKVARMMLCVCKNAKLNKNIKMSFDKVKIDAYCKQIKSLSTKKTRAFLSNVLYDNMDIPHSSFRTNVIKIKLKLLKENAYVLEGVEKGLIIEQLQNLIKYYKKLEEINSIVSNLGVDVTNITEEDGEIYGDDDDYIAEEYNKIKISTIFKFNAYSMNMLFNKMTENAILKIVCSDHYDKMWSDHKKTPFLFA